MSDAEDLSEVLDILTMIVTWADGVRHSQPRTLVDDALTRAHGFIDYRDIAEMTG